MTKRMRSILSAVAISVLSMGLLAGCAGSTQKNETDNGNGASAGTATVIVVDQDEQEYTYELKLDGAVSIREAMIQNQLVPEEEYAAMTFETIDGHVAKMEDGVLWMLYDADGNQLSATTGFAIDDNKVKPGDTIRFVYTVAPNFDD